MNHGMIDRRRQAAAVMLAVLAFMVLPVFCPPAAGVERSLAKELCRDGEQLLKSGELRAAAEKFKQSAEADYLYSRPHYFIGLIHERRGKTEAALAAFNHARELEPHNDLYIRKMAEYQMDNARKLMAAGDYRQALEILDKLENDLPNEVPIYTLQAEAYIQLGNYEQALTALDSIFDRLKNLKIKRADPQVALAFAYSSRAKFKLGRYYAAYSDITEAAKIGSAPVEKLERIEAVVLGPGNPVVRLLKEAEKLYGAGRFNEAAEKYIEIRALDPEAASHVGSRIKESRNRIQAQKLFARYKELVAEKKLPQAMEALESIDNLNLEDERLKGAIRKLKAGLKQTINRAETETSAEDLEVDLERFKRFDLFRAELDLAELYDRAEEHRLAKRYSDAETLYGRIVAEDPEFREASFRFEQMRRLVAQEARRPFIIGGFILAGIFLAGYVVRQLLKRLPETMTQRAFKAFNYHRNAANWQKVVSLGQKLTGKPLMKQDHIKVLLGMTQAYLSLGQYNDALRIASETVRLDQRSGQAHTLLAKAYLALGRDDEIAFAEYQRLYDLEPQNQPLLEALCACYLKRSSTDKKAVDIYKRLLQRDPERSDLLMQIAQAYIEDDRLDGEALALYEKLCGVYPEEIAYHRMLARACLAREMYDEAIDEARFLIEENIKDQVGHEVLTEAYLRRSLIEEAVSVYEDLVRNYPEERFVSRKLDRLRERLVLATGAQKGATTTAIKVCQKCAHLNSNVEETCRNCGSPL